MCCGQADRQQGQSQPAAWIPGHRGHHRPAPIVTPEAGRSLWGRPPPPTASQQPHVSSASLPPVSAGSIFSSRVSSEQCTAPACSTFPFVFILQNGGSVTVRSWLTQFPPAGQWREETEDTVTGCSLYHGGTYTERPHVNWQSDHTSPSQQNMNQWPYRWFLTLEWIFILLICFSFQLHYQLLLWPDLGICAVCAPSNPDSLGLNNPGI